MNSFHCSNCRLSKQIFIIQLFYKALDLFVLKMLLSIILFIYNFFFRFIFVDAKNKL